MLVLSRGLNDQIVFPDLGISVEVLKISGSRTALGVDAPRDIRVLRHELANESEEASASVKPGGAQHELRNQINRATLRLQLASNLLTSGQTDQGLAAMSAGIAELSAISKPSVAKSDTAASEMRLAEAKATFAVQTPSRRRILLVDDDANERTLMASYLQRCGMEVEQVDDGLKALYALSKSERPDAVLLDMNMPNLDGPATVERIRKCSTHPDVPVFAVTGQSLDQTGLQINEDGVTGWFQKPVEVEAIVAAIEDCVTV